MKKWGSALLALWLLGALCAGASANSWGLKGRLLTAVQQVSDWNDYSTLCTQAGDFALLGSRYHNALFCLDGENRLLVFTKAVYQPGQRKEKPSLTLNAGEQTLALRYGSQESYLFSAQAPYPLLSAEIGNFRVRLESAGNYYAQEQGNEVYLGYGLTLSSFNISLFPHSLEEVRALRMMQAKLDSGYACLGWGYGPQDWGQLIQPGRKATAPVYAAPYGASAWRAANGKAAVGLNGEIWGLNGFLNEDGESWQCIRYFVSPRTQRIGYVRSQDLGLPPLEAQENRPGVSFTHVDVETTADTYLTDDPDVSQYPQVSLPQGTQMDCLGLYNDDYAYVALEVSKNNRPADGGAILWGFVPIKALKPMEKPILPDVMEKLVGEWEFYAGGNQAEDILILRADGTFTGRNEPGDDEAQGKEFPGRWYVTAYSPFENLYWNEPPYELTLLHDNGMVNIKGLTLEESGFSLTFWEGGGGYCPLGADPWNEGD